MRARPSIAVKRPTRSAETSVAAPTPIEPTAIPAIDPESSDALAFSMRGRGKSAAHADEPRAEVAAAPVEAPAAGDAIRDLAGARAGDRLMQGSIQVAHSDPTSVNESGQGLISIKLPPDVGRQLAAIADRRGSKRTLIAIEALSEPLRALAAAHRAGGSPELPKIVSGTVRSSIAFALPPDLAADLEFVLKTRRAVRAQVVTRLLAPAVRALYDAEVGRRER